MAQPMRRHVLHTRTTTQTLKTCTNCARIYSSPSCPQEESVLGIGVGIGFPAGFDINAQERGTNPQPLLERMGRRQTKANDALTIPLPQDADSESLRVKGNERF